MEITVSSSVSRLFGITAAHGGKDDDSKTSNHCKHASQPAQKVTSVIGATVSCWIKSRRTSKGRESWSNYRRRGSRSSRAKRATRPNLDQVGCDEGPKGSSELREGSPGKMGQAWEPLQRFSSHLPLCIVPGATRGATRRPMRRPTPESGVRTLVWCRSAKYRTFWNNENQKYNIFQPWPQPTTTSELKSGQHRIIVFPLVNKSMSLKFK